MNFVRHCFAVCFRGYLSVFIIDDNTKIGLRNRLEYGLGNIGEDRCGNRKEKVEYRCHYILNITNYCLSLQDDKTMGITMMNEFEVRSYGGEELAVLYGSDLMSVSAGKRLSKWVGVNPELKTEPQGNGWRKGKKM